MYNDRKQFAIENGYVGFWAGQEKKMTHRLAEELDWETAVEHDKGSNSDLIIVYKDEESLQTIKNKLKG